MPRRKNVFFEPKFNEWLYDVMVNLEKDQLAKLNRVELNMIRNTTALKRFIANENLEKRLSLLTKVGVEWNLSFFKTAKYLAGAIKDVYTQYAMKGQTVENIEEMIKGKAFVINSKEIAISMAMMSNNCHSDVYFINPGFFAFKKTFTELKRKELKARNFLINNTFQNEFKEAQEEVFNLNKLILEIIIHEPFISGVENLQQLDLAILCMLYAKPRTYISVDDIKAQLKVKYKPASIGLRCSYLCRERRLIDKRPSKENVNHYIIMQEGILLLGKIQNYYVNTVYQQ